MNDNISFFYDSLRIAVIGAGSWGTVLANYLVKRGHHVIIWAFESEVAKSINKNNKNFIFMPDLVLDPRLVATNNIAEALFDAKVIVLVIPSHVFRSVLIQAAPYIAESSILVSCTKGLEQGSCYTMCEVVKDVLSKNFYSQICCLSGPSFANEVADQLPTIVTVASQDYKIAQMVQLAFFSDKLRIYTSCDLMGVELGGAVKNPLAIAAGIVVGLNLGYNILAALITRGLNEIGRLSVARGGHFTTLNGLANIGDLVLTSISSNSRNYRVGLQLAEGRSIVQISKSMKMIAEGILNTISIRELASAVGVEMPIIDAVYQVIYCGVSPKEILYDLMLRRLKAEYI